MTKVGERNKVLFQEPLSHAAVGTWIKSGALRYLVVNNRAVLDMPGEFVCTQVISINISERSNVEIIYIILCK